MQEYNKKLNYWKKIHVKSINLMVKGIGWIEIQKIF